MALVTKSFSDIITFTRASTATYFNSAGVLQSAAINAPRFDYNPSTLAARGLLIEEQRTNSIRNNTMQGAVAGTPGTAPTNWALTGAGGNITSLETVSVGTENGIAYIDVRYVFSGAATANVRHEAVNQIAATSTQTWTASAFVKLVGGSTSNITTNIVITQYNSSFAALEATSVPFTPQTTAFGTARPSNTKATTQATVASVTSAVSIVASGAADITLRIGLPQLELGAFATSVIPTTTTALTRSADVASVNTLSPWYNQVSGTMFAEFSSFGTPANFPTVWQLDDGTTQNNLIGYVFTNVLGVAQRTLNVSQGDLNTAGAAINAANTTKMGYAYATNDSALSGNGSALTGTAIDNTVSIPTVTTLRLGAKVTPVNVLNGYLRRITYYPRRLSNAELQAITV